MHRENKILCYGDSNTWGFSPRDGSRFPTDIRWPGVLRRCLGEGCTVIEDGLNGRTLCSFGMDADPLNGSEHLITVVKAYKDVELLIIYLGINDLFVDPEISILSMSLELAETIDTVQKFRPSMKVLVLSPLPVNVGIEYHACYHEQVEKSFNLSGEFKSVAEKTGCDFLDPSQVISASRDDGVHIDAEEHIKLGFHLCTIVRDILRGLYPS